MEAGVKPWHGISRETIVWRPTVDEKKYIGCGMCVTGCGRKVYGFDYETTTGGAKTVQLHGGMRDLCDYLPAGGSFPPMERVRELIRKDKVLAKAMDELKEGKEELKTVPKYD